MKRLVDSLHARRWCHLTCVAYGGVYRPRGMDLGDPAFYVLPLMALFPMVTLLVEQRRRGR